MSNERYFCQCGQQIHGRYTRACPACGAALKPSTIATGLLLQILGFLVLLGGLAAVLFFLLR